MAPRPFLVSGGSEDRPARWIALAGLIFYLRSFPPFRYNPFMRAIVTGQVGVDPPAIR